jgi:transcriptional regulator with XRE-family HTH domain
LSPWFCHDCGQEAVRPETVRNYQSKIKYNGKLYTVEVPEFRVPRCASCKAFVFGNDAEEQISRAFRHQQGLLQPEEIEQNLRDRDLSQRDLADAIGVAEVTVSRWKTGTVFQSKASDMAMRGLFERTPLLAGNAVSSGASRIGQLIEAQVSAVCGDLPLASQEPFMDWLWGQPQEWYDLLKALASEYGAGKKHALRYLVRSLMLRQRLARARENRNAVCIPAHSEGGDPADLTGSRLVDLRARGGEQRQRWVAGKSCYFSSLSRGASEDRPNRFYERTSRQRSTQKSRDRRGT